MDYIKKLVGTHYVWWKPGQKLNKCSPFWYENATPPPIQEIKEKGLNCAGLVNLYIRAKGLVPPKGGTITYWNKFGKDSEVFDSSRKYKSGTIIGRRYRDENDQGHLAISIGNGNLIEAIPEYGVIECSIKESNRLAKEYFKLDTDYYEWTYSIRS